MTVVIHIDSPLVTVKEFAKRSGLSVSAVRHKIDNGEFPTVETKLDPTKKGSVYINMVKLIELAENSEYLHHGMNQD